VWWKLRDVVSDEHQPRSFSRDTGWLARRDCLRVMRLVMRVMAAQVISDSERWVSRL